MSDKDNDEVSETHYHYQQCQRHHLHNRLQQINLKSSKGGNSSCAVILLFLTLVILVRIQLMRFGCQSSLRRFAHWRRVFVTIVFIAEKKSAITTLREGENFDIPATRS